MKHYKGNGAQTPTDKLRSTKVSEFSGAKVKSLIMPVYIGSDDQSSPNDFIDDASDVIQTLNGSMMPAGGQIWPSSIGIAGVQVGSGETIILRAGELYENAHTSTGATAFEGTLLIYDIQLHASSGTSAATVYINTDRGGDGVTPGSGFQSAPFYFFCQAQAVNATAASVFSPSRAPSGLLPLPMGPYTDILIVESGANDMTATIFYAVMSYGGGLA